MLRVFKYATLAMLMLSAPAAMAADAGAKTHMLLLHIDSDNEQLMNMVLGNAMNAKKFWDDRGETLQVEVVAYGPGISMLREDKSPVAKRIAEVKTAMPTLALSMCNNSKMGTEKAEGHPITPLPGVKVVPAGIARIMELEEQGYTYVKP